jgi:hypothetical protein
LRASSDFSLPKPMSTRLLRSDIVVWFCGVGRLEETVVRCWELGVVEKQWARSLAG